MRYLLTTIMLLMLSTSVYASARVNCRVHKIYCKIKKLNPRIDSKRAMLLSNLIFKNAKKFNIDPNISLAILFQENRFRDEHTYHITRSIKEHCDNNNCYKTIVEVQTVFDLGIAQINVATARTYGFDIQRLYNHDIEYAIQCHFIILTDKIQQCANLKEYAWACYHSKTPKYRQNYIKKVNKYLKLEKK